MKIWLHRHAKSSWGNPGQRDFDRPLNKRGSRDAIEMGRWLAAQSDRATWLWTSDAARALATARVVQAAFDIDDDHTVAVHELYLAPPEVLLAVLRRTPAEVESVALVAHNPGITETLNLLAGVAVTANLPTFGTARLDFDGDWAHLGFGRCDIDLVTAPKLLDSRPETGYI
ncbi:MAG: histidine phosphatase family protein [Pseudomonadales bacterium]|nr:histidine phosphatase family protein [Pseudomonadales bacterium]